MTDAKPRIVCDRSEIDSMLHLWTLKSILGEIHSHFIKLTDVANIYEVEAKINLKRIQENELENLSFTSGAELTRHRDALFASLDKLRTLMQVHVTSAGALIDLGFDLGPVVTLTTPLLGKIAVLPKYAAVHMATPMAFAYMLLFPKTDIIISEAT